LTRRRAFHLLVLLGLIAALIWFVPPAKALRGIHGVEVGMEWPEVMDVLKSDICEEDIINVPGGFCVALRDNDLFRHAHCRFNAAGKLVELALTIREVRGMKSALEEIDSTYDPELSTKQNVVRDGAAFSIRGNTLLIRDPAGLPKQAQSRRGPTRFPDPH
jgi:hypothetical protein